jgi:hypothetical protein
MSFKMKKIFQIAIFLVAGFTFSQSKPLSASQIDSIAAKNGRSGIAEGQIATEKQIYTGDKKKIIKGEGQSAVAIFLCTSKGLSRLIKGEYHRNIRYEDKTSQEVSAQFYYDEKHLFYIKLTEIINDGKGEVKRSHEIDVSELALLQSKDFLFTDNIKKWISQVDEQIIKASGHGAKK